MGKLWDILGKPVRIESELIKGKLVRTDYEVYQISEIWRAVPKARLGYKQYAYVYVQGDLVTLVFPTGYAIKEGLAAELIAVSGCQFHFDLENVFCGFLFRGYKLPKVLKLFGTPTQDFGDGFMLFPNGVEVQYSKRYRHGDKVKLEVQVLYPVGTKLTDLPNSLIKKLWAYDFKFVYSRKDYLDVENIQR